MSYILLLLGFVLLIKGADYFVEGASSIAKKFRIPTLIIGLTIVAFGTSAPEAAVSIASAIKGQNEIALGNVIGSNIFNLLFVVGMAAVICPLQVKKSMIIKEFPFAILSCLVLVILVQDQLFGTSTMVVLNRGDGLILLLFFCIFMYYLIGVAISARSEAVEEEIAVMPLGRSSLFTLGGIIGIVVGGDIVVDSASEIALAWGMSQNLVGLTIVAVGTSLPELVTSIVAARKGETDITLGNVIGSNLFNVFFILGISSCIHPIAVNPNIIVDSLFLLAVTLVTYFFAITKKTINKIEGGCLVAVYIIYMIFIIIRN